MLYYCCRSLISDLLHHLSYHPHPSLHYLSVRCDDNNDVRALTAFLPQCTNLRTLHYERGRYNVSEIVEEQMWRAAVRRCRNLEEVRMGGEGRDVSCDRLLSVLMKLSERERIQALKLRSIVRVDWETGKEDYTEHFKHLLPVVQQ